MYAPLISTGRCDQWEDAQDLQVGVMRLSSLSPQPQCAEA
jgi:hypothetical protein